jgi:hypothetical protein
MVPVNDVTSFLDLSIIYGNSSTVNALLRANDGSGKLLPRPMATSSFGKPGLANDCGAFDPVSNPASASGDSRVDENLFLDAVHSLLFRNHNRDAEDGWPRIVRSSRRMRSASSARVPSTSARFQQQVYNELLPAVFGRAAVARYLGPYAGYDAIDRSAHHVHVRHRAARRARAGRACRRTSCRKTAPPW